MTNISLPNSRRPFAQHSLKTLSDCRLALVPVGGARHLVPPCRARHEHVASVKHSASSRTSKQPGEIFFIGQTLSAEDQPGQQQKQSGVSHRVERGQSAIQPVHQPPVVDHPFAHVKQFQMRNDEVNRVNDAAQRFGIMQRDGVQMAPQKQNAGDDDEQIVTVDDGAAKTSEPSSVIAITMPSMIHCNSKA